MKQFLKDNWLQIIMVIALFVIMIFIFQKRYNSDELNAYKIKQLEDKISPLEKEIDSLKLILKHTDNSVNNHFDSLLKASIDANQKTIYELKRQKTLVNTANFSSDDLKSYFSNLK